jgi:hypothetical protein
MSNGRELSLYILTFIYSLVSLSLFSYRVRCTLCGPTYLWMDFNIIKCSSSAVTRFSKILSGLQTRQLANLDQSVADLIRVCYSRNVMLEMESVQNTRNFQLRSSNHCCCGKAISITYSECVSVALAIQHAKRMRCTIFFQVISQRAWFSRGGGEGVISMKCVFWFSLQVIPETPLILRRTQPDIITNM